ncbi:hypothetical protein [Micromonospora sp. LOL_021]|uniref:hypothetical protein n=1 Tax=Micromonospora sp. LOL_021 TaxID=3345417 RepID=UPI003A83CC42
MDRLVMGDAVAERADVIEIRVEIPSGSSISWKNLPQSRPPQRRLVLAGATAANQPNPETEWQLSDHAPRCHILSDPAFLDRILDHPLPDECEPDV